MNIPRSTKTQAFSLIELLVSITIISILSGLVISGARHAMDAARRTRDVHNVQQIGTILLMEALENGGRLRQAVASVPDQPPTTKDILQGLINDGMVNDPAILVGQGATSAKSLRLTDDNIGFQYIAGYLDTGLGRMPLLFTKGVALTPETLSGDTFAVPTSAWRYSGMAVFYLSGNGAWLRGRELNGQMKLNDPLSLGQVPSGLEIYR